MNPPRLILQAALAGSYGGAALALLIRRLNPTPAAGSWLSIDITVACLYTLAAGALWPLLYGAVRFFARHALRVPWLSLRYLLAFHAANGAVILASAWSASSRFRKVLSPGEIERLSGFCIMLSAGWAAAAIVSVVPALRRHRTSQIGAAALSLLVLGVASLSRREAAADPGSLLRARRPEVSGPSRRLVLINLDGADLDMVLTLQAQGQLPAFRRLKDEGAYGRLRSLTPCEAAVTRTTLVTGRKPFRHGVRSGILRIAPNGGPTIQLLPPRLGLEWSLRPILLSRPASIHDRRGPALWDLALQGGGMGGEAGFDIDLDQGEDEAVVTAARRRELVAEFLDPEIWRRAEERARRPLTALARACAADDEVARALVRLLADTRPGVTAVSFPGLDRVAHVFLRYAHPEEFGNVTKTEVDLYGEVLQRYYRRLDGIVGRALDSVGDAGWVVVTSSHGMDPVPLRRRLLELRAGDDSLAGTHEGGPDGFVVARGPGVRPGLLAGKGLIADVVPTALYALRLPVARDLDGAILTGIFAPGYMLAHPVAVISSYD